MRSGLRRFENIAAAPYGSKNSIRRFLTYLGWRKISKLAIMTFMLLKCPIWDEKTIPINFVYQFGLNFSVLRVYQPLHLEVLSPMLEFSITGMNRKSQNEILELVSFCPEAFSSSANNCMHVTKHSL